MTNLFIQNAKPQVMGILNVTPDSFSDGGRFNSLETAFLQAKKMVEEGASIIDVGGESTRPGALTVSLGEELSRVIPIVERIKEELDVVISVDTIKPEVMLASVEAGASMINDVNALEEDGAIKAACQTNATVCLMHKKGPPQTMQHNPHYDSSVVHEVRDYLKQRVNACIAGGIKKQHLIIDIGFGFGKSVQHNLLLIKNLSEFKVLGLPLLIGVSRKSTIGNVLDLDVDNRLVGSLTLAQMSLDRGANILRAHDVKETMQMINMWWAVQQAA